MKILQSATPPPAVAANFVPVTVGTVELSSDGKLLVRLSVPVIEFEFTAVTDILPLLPGSTINLTAWIQT